MDDDPDADFIWNRDVYGQQEEAIIIGLRDNTNYWVRVQVYNNAGLGPIGEWRLAETFHLRKLIQFLQFLTSNILKENCLIKVLGYMY